MEEKLLVRKQINLTRLLNGWIQRQVEEGAFKSESECIRVAVERLKKAM